MRDAYYYRRPLRLRELLPAVGLGIGAGLFAFYLTRLFLERTPLRLKGSRTSALSKKETREQP